jgi:hypothetical protein
MWTHVRALLNTSGTTWLGLGFADTKTKNTDGSCNHSLIYYWERGLDLAITKGAMPAGNGTPNPGSSNHDHSLNRIYDGTGYNDCCGTHAYCWVFRIDGNTGVDQVLCCGGSGTSSVWYRAVKVQASQECGLWENVSGEPCDTVGMTDPVSGLTYKNTSDNWVNRSGQDYACVDYGRGARGDWKSATSTKQGYNVGTSGSGFGNC